MVIHYTELNENIYKLLQYGNTILRSQPPLLFKYHSSETMNKFVSSKLLWACQKL